MNTLLPHLLDVSLCLVALFIAVRSFDIYARFHQYRLFLDYQWCLCPSLLPPILSQAMSLL